MPRELHEALTPQERAQRILFPQGVDNIVRRPQAPAPQQAAPIRKSGIEPQFGLFDIIKSAVSAPELGAKELEMQRRREALQRK